MKLSGGDGVFFFNPPLSSMRVMGSRKVMNDNGSTVVCKSQKFQNSCFLSKKGQSMMSSVDIGTWALEVGMFILCVYRSNVAKDNASGNRQKQAFTHRHHITSHHIIISHHISTPKDTRRIHMDTGYSTIFSLSRDLFLQLSQTYDGVARALSTSTSPLA